MNSEMSLEEIEEKLKTVFLQLSEMQLDVDNFSNRLEDLVIEIKNILSSEEIEEIEDGE